MMLKPLIKTPIKPLLAGVLQPLFGESTAPPATPVEEFDFTTGTLPANLTFARSGTASYRAADGSLAYAAADVPRFARDDSFAVTGLMIEPAATNSAWFSEDFTNATWIKQAVTITAGATTAPDGTMTASKMVSTNASGFHFIKKNAGAVKMAGSVFMKAEGLTNAWIAVGRESAESVRAQAVVNLIDGSVVRTQVSSIENDFRIEKYIDGWWRVCLSGEPSASANTSLYFGPGTAGPTSHVGDGTQGIYIWGGNVAAGATISSYIPTPGGSSATRASESLSLTNISGVGVGQGTLLVKMTHRTYIDNAVNAVMFTYRGSSTSNEMYARFIGSGIRCIAVVSTEQANFVPLGPLAADTTYTLAFAYKANDFAASVNGNAVVVDTAGAVPPSVTALRIANYSSDRQPIGVIHKFAYYNTRLPDATLVELSAG